MIFFFPILSRPESREPEPTNTTTFLLDRLIVDLQMHHWRRAIPQNFPVASVLLVTGAYLVSALVCPPQLVPWNDR